ncbi:zonular occludens toxin domain-containing protein [Thalassomonas sp. RHCl1]|uniref:zonular occludens toxin family protein n=1 Tax=Thalassomonas sp. RHCl1 TaxID=2995320 RepID=UPI00248C8CF7|nr:zonular occludens toxin domain-containing protein [Thalassomonas sp. RHCl1]
MAASIFHGAPGSFKSASAFWFEVLPALRQGRVVVTNIEGILPKESIEIELDEVFPETADVWRLSSQTDKGLFLWRRWFWWMPVEAFIILDEVQDVFPNDSTVFKPVELDSQGIGAIKDQLPDKYYDHYQTAIANYTPPNDEGSIDDTGEIVLDENGHIIYPKNMREANMRHRKYNWDIIYCTPEITEIHKLVRSVCQYAYKYKYFDSLEFIPWFKRRPRYHEHSPKSSGETLNKGQPKKWRRIPEAVHKCYRSTSTGQITKRRGANGLKDPTLIFAIALLLCCFGYATWWLFLKPERQDPFSTELVSKETTEKTRSNTAANNPFSPDNDSRPAADEVPVPIELPFQATDITFNGYLDITDNNQKYREYFFTMRVGHQDVYVNQDDLRNFGFKVSFINQCMVRLKKGEFFKLVTCNPRQLINTEEKDGV